MRRDAPEAIAISLNRIRDKLLSASKEKGSLSGN
jgi:hypothetical protein